MGRKKAIGDSVGYVLIAPFLLFFIVFILMPIIINLFLSFTNFNLRSISFVGLKNYKFLIKDNFFLTSLRNTLVYTFFTLTFTMALSLLAANTLNQEIKGKNFYKTFFFLPHVTSMVAVSMVWFWMYEPSYGIINSILKLANIEGKLWLFDVKLAMPSIIIMSVWKSLGYYMVIYLAGLQGIPIYLYEAATIDGANKCIQFFRITIPMLSPVTFFLFVTGVIFNFNVFEQILILTDGGPMNSTTTVVHQLFKRAFTDFLMGYAAAQSFLILLIIAFLTMLFFKYGRSGVDTDAS